MSLSPATEALYQQRLKSFISPEEWAHTGPMVEEINRLKREKGAVILAHNYMTPDIFHAVADFVGDSLALARKATETDAQIIVQCGVHFMAETSKILNVDKTVLLPDMAAGCSLADSITAEDIRLLKQKYPGVPVVTYVNTSAEVKAETDICCTSANALQVVESLGVDKVLFLPDQYLANWVAKQTDVKILTWQGACEVHERFTAQELDVMRTRYGGDIVIIAHPECPPDVLDAADFVGSTSEMINYAKREKPARVLMVTECSMSDNVAAELPEVEFIRPCHLCPHMKRITLPKLLETLRTLGPEVTVDPVVAERARKAIDNMLALTDPQARNETVKAAS